MQVKFVSKGERGLEVNECAIDDARTIGGAVIGFNWSRQQRAELQGLPKFADWLGPMYDGPGRVRYESEAAYAQLSA